MNCFNILILFSKKYLPKKKKRKKNTFWILLLFFVFPFFELNLNPPGRS